MAQGKILVLGVLRLGLNADYDRLRQLANEHRTIRQVLGHTGWADCEGDLHHLPYPTDIVLWWDAIRKLIETIAGLWLDHKIAGADAYSPSQSPERPLHMVLPPLLPDP